MNSPFPTQNNSSKSPVDGIFSKIPHHCRVNYNHKCKAHYENIKNKEGFHTCPYGFTTHIVNLNSKLETLTSLNIEELGNSKLIRKHLRPKKDMSVKLKLAHYNDILDKYESELQRFTGLKNLLNDGNQVKRKNEQNIKLISNILHEVRKLNAQIKKQSEQLKLTLDKRHFDSIRDLQKNIFSTSQLISTRLDAYDFTINPNLIDMHEGRLTRVYKKFEKAFHCIKQTAKEKSVKIFLKGNSEAEIKAYRIFELLPFMLLENALKYSPENKDINCYFDENNNRLNSIVIDNYGPVLTSGELERITEKGYRGENAQSIDGSGIGLYLAKLICDYHDIQIEFSEYGQSVVVGNRIYKGFRVKLYFSNL